MSGVSLEALQQAWAIAGLPLAQGTAMRLPDMQVSVLRQILNDTASTAGSPYIDIDLEAIKQQLQLANSTRGKLDRVVRVPYWKHVPPTLDNNIVLCNTEGSEIETGVLAFKLEAFTGDQISLPNSICREATHMEKKARSLQQLIYNAVVKLSEQVAQKLFTLGNGYIGKLPMRDNLSGARNAGEALPIFHIPNAGFDPALNLKGLETLQRDFADGMMPANHYMIGGSRAQTYRTAFALQGYRNDGYDYSKAADPTGIAVYTHQLSKYTNLTNPILFVPNGYVKFVSVAINTPEFGNEILDGDLIRTTVVDPYFGLTWDFTEYREVCAQNGVNYKYTLSLNWGLAVMPVCEDAGDPRLEGLNGLFLYNAVCSEDTICDSVDGGYITPTVVTNREACVIEEPAGCNTSCTLGLAEIPRTPTSTKLLLNAMFTPSQGATIVSYVWAINAVVDGTNTEAIGSFTLAGLSNGDVITVTATDSLGCELSASFTYTVVI